MERRHESDGVQYFDVRVTPLHGNGTAWLGTSITFEDVTVRQRLQLDLQRTTQELETTNEQLQSAHEQLETTNEELQTMNTELRQRTDSLDTMNSFLQAILGSLHWGVVVVDRQTNVLEWNRRAEDLWGLRADEVRGRSLLSLDIELPVGQLAPAAILAGKVDSKELTLPAINRRGKGIVCSVIMTPFVIAGDHRRGVVVTMDEQGYKQGESERPIGAGGVET